MTPIALKSVLRFLVRMAAYRLRPALDLRHGV